jgi:hypothetical protein
VLSTCVGLVLAWVRWEEELFVWCEYFMGAVVVSSMLKAACAV